MKKSMVILVLAVTTTIVSSCSVYTCPTYAKKVNEQPFNACKI